MMDQLESQLSFITDISPVDFITTAISNNPVENSMRCAYKNERGLARIAISGLFLGIIATTSLFSIYFFPSLWRIFLVSFFSCVYHLSEFLMTALGHPEKVAYDSFLFYQSFDYALARILYHLEFFFWYFVWNTIRDNPYSNILSVIGIIGVVIGQSIRTIAMYQARQSFTHIVSHTKKDDHVLVTHGIFAYFRHPSYFGWFVWAMSLQLVLFNPFFFVGSFVLAYTFFSQRIPAEEAALIQFFGEKYEKYRDTTPTWLPFIR